MAASFLFYDLETSGISPREDRVMQFAAQRTDMNLRPIGEPYNYLIALTPEILPDPQAILVTGITPQKTVAEGITEAEFVRIFQTEITSPGTIFTGFNSLRFDDEFLRFLHFRNFHDPYEWSWRDKRSRWDLLDVSRMTRALRPEGITWPFASDGKPTNRLEMLTSVNAIAHDDAHDALSDVRATISLARLIRDKQPKLFEYLLGLRDKREVAKLVESNEPFVYTSGRYDGDHEKTTVAQFLRKTDQAQSVLVFDLRHDPAMYLDISAEELAAAMKLRHDERPFPVPVKRLKYNRAPAIAPLGVLDAASQKRLQLPLETIHKHAALLRVNKSKLEERFTEAFSLLQQTKQQEMVIDEITAESQLYDGFIPDEDKPLMRKVTTASPKELTPATLQFRDERLNHLLPLYKARNFPESLSSEEHTAWEAFRYRRLMEGGEQSRMQQFVSSLQTCAQTDGITDQQRYLLEEIKLYAESIAPLE